LYPWHRSFALLVSAAGSPIKIIDETWEDLVTKKILTSEEAAGIGLAISLYRLLGDKAGLAAAIKPNVTSRPGITHLSVGDWEEAITASKTAPSAEFGGNRFIHDATLRLGNACEWN